MSRSSGLEVLQAKHYAEQDREYVGKVKGEAGGGNG
jgi:hypothetical protein